MCPLTKLYPPYLQISRMSSNKFRLVRRLRCLASEQGILGVNLHNRIFGALKRCIPPLDQLQEDDIYAFSGPSSLSEGEISSFGVEPTRTPSILQAIVELTSLRKIEDGIFPPVAQSPRNYSVYWRSMTPRSSASHTPL